VTKSEKDSSSSPGSLADSSYANKSTENNKRSVCSVGGPGRESVKLNKKYKQTDRRASLVAPLWGSPKNKASPLPFSLDSLRRFYLPLNFLCFCCCRFLRSWLEECRVLLTVWLSQADSTGWHPRKNSRRLSCHFKVSPLPETNKLPNRKIKNNCMKM